VQGQYTLQWGLRPSTYFCWLKTIFMTAPAWFRPRGESFEPNFSWENYFSLHAHPRGGVWGRGLGVIVRIKLKKSCKERARINNIGDSDRFFVLIWRGVKSANGIRGWFLKCHFDTLRGLFGSLEARFRFCWRFSNTYHVIIQADFTGRVLRQHLKGENTHSPFL
jgi:hypothetical protein